MTFLWPLVVKSTVVLVLGAVVAIALRRSSASSRHAVWAFALAGLLVLPALGMWLPRWEVAVLPPAAPPATAATMSVPSEVVLDPGESAGPYSSFADEHPAPLSHADSRVVASSAASWRDALPPLWLFGVAFAIAHFMLGTALIAWTAHRSRPVDDETWRALLAEAQARLRLRRRVDMRQTAAITLPIVWGYRRPVVLLPEDAVQWPHERRRAFLLHELAHVARYDCFTQTLACLVRALYWPHPLVWWAVAALRREAERACDDRVVSAGTDAPEYAQHLLDAARRLPRAPRTLAPASAVVERTRLGDRLLALLDENLNRRAITRRTLAVGGLAALVAIAVVATLQPVARAAVVEVVQAAVAAAAPTAAPAAASPATSSSIPAARPQPRPAVTKALHGTVKGPDGKPVPKAMVFVSGPPRGIGIPGRTESTRTDDAGAFRVEAFAGDGPYDVRADAAGLARETVWAAGPGVVDITLTRGQAIEGTVRDATTRKPIPKVTLSISLAVPMLADSHTRVITASTDEGGRYRLEGLPAGPHNVAITAPGYFRQEQRGSAAARVDVFLRAGGTSIVGSVKDPDGKPVAQASVVAELDMPAGAPATRTRSDAAGRFEVSGLERGSYRLVVRHPDWPPALVTDVTATEKPTAVEISMPRPYRVVGRLVTSDERPVKGDVLLQAVDGHELPATLARQYVADAGTDGRFRLIGLPPGALTLAVRPLQFAPRRADITVGGKDPEVDAGDIRVELGHVIRGRVRTKEGHPIAGAQVYTPAVADPGDTRTETDGTFVMAGVRAGTQRIEVAANGYASANQSAEPDVKPLDIVMEPEAGVSGVLVDASGKPVSGAVIEARRPDNRSRTSKLTESDGRFKIGHLDAGTYILYVQPREHLDKVVKDVELKVGRTTDVGRVVLESGATVHGVVVDGNGVPVAGAKVEFEDAALPFRNNDYGQVQRPTTDAEGRFVLRGLSAGKAKLSASHPSYAAATPVEVTVDAEAPARARLTVLEGARVTGTARGRDGRPITNAFVAVRVPSLPRGGGLDSPLDAEGRFTIDHVTPGLVKVILLEGSVGRYSGVMEKEVEVRDGETATVDLTVLDVLISGRVTRGGKPVAGHVVRLIGGGGGGGMYTAARLGVPDAPRVKRLEGETGADGSYQLIAPMSGKYQVSVRAMNEAQRGGHTRIDDVVVADAPTFRHDIALPDWSITGRVTAKDTQRPLERASVSARPVSGEPRGAGMSTDAEGRFRLALEPGAYIIRVQAPKYVAEETTFDAGGAAVERQFTLTPGRTITGRTVNASGVPRGRVAITAVGPDPRSIRNGDSQADGSFTVDGLEAGPYLLFAADGERPDFAMQAGVLPGGDALSLTLTEGAAVRISFKRADGSPLAETNVRLDLVALGGVPLGVEGRSALSQTQRTDAGGTAEYRLPTGALDVIAATQEGRLRGESRLTVPAGAPATAEMELRPRR